MIDQQKPVRTVDDMGDAELYDFMRDRKLTHEDAVAAVEGRRAKAAAPPADAEPDIANMDNADLYEFLRDQGNTHEQATGIVELKIKEEQQPTFGGGSGAGAGAGGSWGDDPRVAGRKAAASETGVRGVVSPAIQGAGSAAFGIGTPITAAGEFISSRVKGEPRSVGESLEFARGYREGSYEENPNAYRGGFVGGLVSSSSAVKQALSKAPAVVKSVFTLQSGQTKRNIGRLAAAGAAASGATATMQEGTDATLPATAAGAVLGPVAAGLTRTAVGAGRAAMARIRPDNAAIRVLSKRFKESGDKVAKIYNDFVDRTGRRPGLAEIVSEVEAGRVGQLGAQFSSAGRVFREAEEAAALARPRELKTQIEKGGRTTNIAEQTDELKPITDEARGMYGPGESIKSTRVTSTATAQEGFRKKVMDKVMARIGGHQINVGEELRDVIEHEDVQSVLSPILRRRVNDAIQTGEDMGTINIPVRTWEMIRYDLAKKSSMPGASQLYSKLRDKVVKYVGDRVPEYGRALQEFGRRSTGAEMMGPARAAVQKSTREFVDMLKASSERPHRTTARVAARVDVRGWLADELATPAGASRVMKRLARDGQLRTNLRAVLRPNEMQELAALGEQYGHRLNIIEGVKVGSKVMSDDARFADAVRAVSDAPGGRAGVRAGARGTLASKAGESPAKAVSTAAQLAENPGLQDRLSAALGMPEASRLQRVGELTTRAARNLRSATPHAGQAQQEATEQAQKAYNVITAAVAATGTASGALKAHLAQRIGQRISLGSKAATRLAEYATNPDLAEEAIRRMRSAGVSSTEILRWYQDAAVAAGLTVGSEMK